MNKFQTVSCNQFHPQGILFSGTFHQCMLGLFPQLDIIRKSPLTNWLMFELLSHGQNSKHLTTWNFNKSFELLVFFLFLLVLWLFTYFYATVFTCLFLYQDVFAFVAASPSMTASVSHSAPLYFFHRYIFLLLDTWASQPFSPQCNLFCPM